MNQIDYQNNDYDFLLQLRAAQDRVGASVLDKALACDLFTVITEGKSRHDVMQLLQLDEIGTQLFLDVLAKMGLIIQNEGFSTNAQGQPPTREFQKVMLNAEKLAFQQGFYKAFSFWAGPCHLCEECRPPSPPKKCTAMRPSMESAGIDVFATINSVGKTMRTLKGKTEFVKYFGLLLLE